MNIWEILCVTLGLINLAIGSTTKTTNKENFKFAVIAVILDKIISALLILLPLYFNYWRG